MLTTCVTVSIIFAMLMYEISYSVKETLNEDDVTTVSSVRDYGPVSYGRSRKENNNIQEALFSLAGSELETM
ncbi:unnamed protein product [Strongylus vulgaris]|uniref:Uncharacterized protein n=1 Tax=Strongylus vulgaris TaxID=40348 RepID=A0A3P7JFA5_STRVU|nr:unnamed protein product [Strongylus vulgaris]